MTRQPSLLDGGYGDVNGNGNGNMDMKSHIPSPRGVVQWCKEIARPAILTRSGPRQPLRATAYLDGLRGFAAFMVYWHHHQLWPRTRIFADQNLENGFGYEGRYYFACLPLIRTFFSGGHFAVSIFFVISGYVLSTKPLHLIYAKEHAKLAENVGSALFRRWLRLFLPVIATTFLYMTSWHLFGYWTITPKHKHTYREELWNWYSEFKDFSFAFRSSGEPWITYNFHVWSIPVEFRGSIVIYTCLLAFSRSTRSFRLGAEGLLIIYFMYVVDGWYASMFLAGMMLCELDMMAKKKILPQWMTNLEPHKTAIFYTFLAFSTYLSAVPSHSADIKPIRETPGWYYLSLLKPQALWDSKWFYLWWASVFLISATPRIPWLKRFFEIRFCQYLGHISFCLYLCHGPVLWVLGDRLYSATGWYRELNEINIPNWINAFPLSKEGPLGFDMAFLAPQIILLPTTLWVAEMATKLFDEPSVKFARWLYEKSLAPSEKS